MGARKARPRASWMIARGRTGPDPTADENADAAERLGLPKVHILFWRRKAATDTGTFVTGKVRKHEHVGGNPTKCETCGAPFSSAVHK